MKQLKVALCVIAKDRERQILRMLDSTQGVFDGYFLQDTGSKDQTVEVFEKWCKEHGKECKTSKKFIGKDYKSVMVEDREWLGDFASARNDSFALAKGYDYGFWMDSDDVLVSPQVLPEMVQRMNKEGVQVGLMTYVYAKSFDGLKPVVQKRERIIDLNIEGKWIDRVHETYEITPPHKIVDIPMVSVEHERTANEAVSTGRRNNLIMTQQLKEDGLEKFSNKMLHNLAFDHWEHREFRQSLKYYKILANRLKKTNDFDMLYNSYIKMGFAYLSQNKPYKAVTVLLKASNVHPELAEPYITIAQCYIKINRWEEAATYARKVIELGKPNTPAPINEYEFLITPRKILEQYYLFKGMNAEALAMANEIVKISPMVSHKQDRQNVINESVKQDAMRGLAQLTKYIINTNDTQMFDRLKTAIPLKLKEERYIQQVIKEVTDNYSRKGVKTILIGKKSIVFFVGGHYEAWDGNSDKEKGIGGSEGMCIQMSRELAKLGNEVYVYNECGESDGKVMDGVTYLDWKKFDAKLKCDVLVIMRRPDMFKNVFRATKQYLWLHDTEYGDGLELAHFYAPNKVIVLSEAHKNVIRENHGVVDEKAFWITRNGINEIAVKYADKKAGKRDPYKFIYASSYDRGLDNVLKMWPVIREKHPQATLDIYYGWNTYDAMMNQRQGTPQGDYMKQYKAQIVGMMTQLAPYGVREVGRVSQNELYKAFKESSIWIYPTAFYEISCINAMTAQAMGCVPV
ncbi:MAG: glycosyltransferase, partial [Candidatus Kaiserbacteria bacterium]|nr:glycosyltransferase [Candidatus Kaiserbacteria bacterium]